MHVRLDTIIIGVALIVCHHLNFSVASKNANEARERNKRFVFLESSGMGVS